MNLIPSSRHMALSSILLFAGLAVNATAITAVGQQDLALRQLEHKDYDVWNRLTSTALSRDGKWVMFSIQNGAIDGEATLTIRNVGTGSERVIPRGFGGRFTYNSRFAVYRITPEKKKLKQLRKEKAKPSAMPKTQFQILELDSGKLTTLEGVRRFSLPEESGDWLACLMESTDQAKLKGTKSPTRETYEVTSEGLRRPTQPMKLKKRVLLNQEPMTMSQGVSSEEEKSSGGIESSKTKQEKEEDNKDDAESKKEKEAGAPLKLIDLHTGLHRTFPNVADFAFSKNGKVLAFTTSVEDNESSPAEKKKGQDADKHKGSKTNDHHQTDAVYVIQLDKFNEKQIASGKGEYKNLAFNEDGTQLSFLTNKDDYSTKTPTWAVYHWKARAKDARKIAAEGVAGMPTGWWVAPNSTQQFSEDGQRLYFETAPVPELVLNERSDKGVEEGEDEKAKLDIWHWQDPSLQPQQLLRAESERRRDYRASFNLNSQKIVQLATPQIPDVRVDLQSKSSIAIANSNMPYRKMMSWDIPGFQDAYLVNLNTGKREKVLEQVRWNASLSPEGKYITWFDADQRKWFGKSTDRVKSDAIEISKGITLPLQDELHDTPSLPSAYGSPGWTINDESFLIYDRYDIWQLDPAGEADPVCLTGGVGREKKIRFRYRRLDPEERAINLGSSILLSAFNESTKASGFYSLASSGNADEGVDERAPSLAQLIMLDENLSGLRKAEESDTVIFSRSTFQMYGDLWASDLSFKNIDRLSDANPQQENYTWGTAELVHWKATDGQELDGILYKPDGFDPAKAYPMMVYFYERNSDNLHSYYVPEAGRSIINHSFYVSRGYLVFVPDIPYKTGEPGPSAANAILPGVQSLIDQGFVDEKKIGMQGHSWGGYQTAYLVTQTNMFACAESGAPVSNMTSAYGGIRWSSGMSRMFQYERTQSRIGSDLWSSREKYIDNSPVFFADKIETPLLILHNDQDGAVPWYQGIELFVALRRLEKKAWMLNYNGNPHWVMGDYNRRDFAMRMQQFFDHYLMEAPEPEWMAVGLPAVNKGKEFGLELLEPEAAASEEAVIEPETKAEAGDK